MSGRKHHIVPKNLQKGFSKQIKGGFQSVRYNKNGKIFENNTSNIFAERDYYLDGGDSVLDDLMTHEENTALNLLLDQARSGMLESDALKIVPKVICDLYWRSSGHRVGMTSLAEDVTLKIREAFGDKDFLKKIVTSKGFIKYAAESISEKLGFSSQLMIAMIELAMDNEGAWEEFEKTLLPVIAQMFEYIIPEIAKQARNSHNKRLLQLHSKECVDQIFSEFTYSVERFKDENIILGDSMVYFLSDCGFVISTNIHGDSVGAVIVPVSPSYYIAGYRKEKISLGNFDVNLEIAKCCTDGFIYFEKNKSLEALVNIIGQGANGLYSGNFGIDAKKEIENFFARLFL